MNSKNKDFNDFTTGLESPANISIGNPATTLVSYDYDPANGTDERPRSVRCDAAGIYVYKDALGVTSTKNVLQSEVINVRPTEITAATTIITHSMW